MGGGEQGREGEGKGGRKKVSEGAEEKEVPLSGIVVGSVLIVVKSWEMKRKGIDFFLSFWISFYLFWF